VICHVGPAPVPAELNLPGSPTPVRISVFMNVFNVHVNRAPLAGVVETVAYRPGKFFNASFDKASEFNERSGMVLKLADGRRVACVQIAGLIARRIVSRVKPGDTLLAGQRYGLIRFGSRVDVYLPEGVTPLVKVGDTSVAGETVFAWLPKN
jgi:phosphatidylserine decarboxylase